MDGFRGLGAAEQHYIAQYIRMLVPVAKDTKHPMHDLARRNISLSLWRWTADAVNGVGIVKHDAFKYNVEFHAATVLAKDLRGMGCAQLRHEHVVPRKLLTSKIIDDDMSTPMIADFLSKFCLAAIVTKEEDSRLKPKDAMPEGWNWDSRRVYLRYDRSEIELFRGAVAVAGVSSDERS